MLIAWAPPIAIVVGLLMWVLPLPLKAQRAGEIIFACGIFVSLFGTTRR